MGEITDFEQQKIKISKGDQLFLFSDGLPDQFGGEKKQKVNVQEFLHPLRGDLSTISRRKKHKIEVLYDAMDGRKYTIRRHHSCRY